MNRRDCLMNSNDPHEFAANTHGPRGSWDEYFDALALSQLEDLDRRDARDAAFMLFVRAMWLVLAGVAYATVVGGLA
jgi:hypothetical protein